MSKIDTMNDLVADLSEAYTKLRSRELPIAEAKEIANMAGKLIKAAAEQLKYQQFMDKKEDIAFFKNNPLNK